MVHYKTNSSGGFDFAFAMPFSNGITGRQYVPFNTFQPSLNATDASNLLTNWIQITNLETSAQTGTLYFYDMDGTLLGTQPVSLDAGSRRDYSGHQFGANKVGFVEWVAASSTAQFRLRNVRYYYDNAAGDASFHGAFQLQGTIPTGELIAVPLDTSSSSAIIEVSNTTTTSVSVAVNVYDSLGTRKYTQTKTLAAHETWHLITDSYLNGNKGIATIDASVPESIIAVVMQYGRTASLGIQTLYGIQARQNLGSVLRGSYNTFLEQGCRLLVANPTGTARSVTITMTRYDGTQPLVGQSETVPAHGLLDYNLCTHEIDDVYGVVTVAPDVGNSVIADVVRYGLNDDYRFPTPVRQ